MRGYFFFQIVFKGSLTIPLVTTNAKLILALAIPTDKTITVVNEKRETSLPAPDKASKVLSA